MQFQIREMMDKKKDPNNINQPNIYNNYFDQNERNESDPEGNFQDERPEDFKYLFKENWDGLNPPKFEIPMDKIETLFVTKPIGPYEPYNKDDTYVFNPDPTVACKPLPSKPASHSIMRDCNVELNGEMLKRIQSGPKMIDFGVLFVNSDTKRWFYIKNDLKHAIQVRLLTNHEHVNKSYQKPQIIGSGQSAGF